MSLNFEYVFSFSKNIFFFLYWITLKFLRYKITLIQIFILNKNCFFWLLLLCITRHYDLWVICFLSHNAGVLMLPTLVTWTVILLGTESDVYLFIMEMQHINTRFSYKSFDLALAFNYCFIWFYCRYSTWLALPCFAWSHF